MDWADKRVRTNFLSLATQDGADIAVLPELLPNPPDVSYSENNADWLEYLFLKGAPLMAPPDVVNKYFFLEFFFHFYY